MLIFPVWSSGGGVKSPLAHLVGGRRLSIVRFGVHELEHAVDRGSIEHRVLDDTALLLECVLVTLGSNDRRLEADVCSVHFECVSVAFDGETGVFTSPQKLGGIHRSGDSVGFVWVGIEADEVLGDQSLCLLRIRKPRLKGASCLLPAVN